MTNDEGQRVRGEKDSAFPLRNSALPAIVLFDGVCNLCNGFVQFVIRRDPRGYFRFASLGSAAARDLLDGATIVDPLPDSIVLMEGRRVFVRSTAALRIARRLTFPWPLAYALMVIPRPVRDLIYDRIARRRYQWFGRRESCMVPGSGLRPRFL